MQIVGAIDAQGRCRHWHSPRDVVANRCATCGKWFACYLCHPADHDFGPAALGDAAVACGACSYRMSYAEYAGCGSRCPGCGHDFNPGCAAHAGIYFRLTD